MKRYFFCLIFLPVFLSCGVSKKGFKAKNAKEDALFNKWLTHSKSELIEKWGQPDSTATDGKSGNILIYKEGIDFKSVMNEKYTGKQFSFRKEMYVNADSIIYNWKAWRRK